MEADHGTHLGCSVRKRVSVVVDMGFALVLRVRILMRLMVVVHGRMAVLVVVGGRHVLPVGPVALVVDDASVQVPMRHGIVMVQRQRPHLPRALTT
jgi:hypothetical protein